MSYFKEIAVGVWRLMQGMGITMRNMLRPKVTEQYPENRGKKVYPEAFRALLTMPHDADNRHRCTGCGICALNCPNGTIRVETLLDEQGKKRLLAHRYDLGSCTFCALCTQSCPQNAIAWSNAFEHAVFDKEKLHLQLNKPGSSLWSDKA